MNANENSCTNMAEDIIVLGIASVETLGIGAPSVELMGNQPIAGISED